ncbi:MAG: DUF4197 domain-containing protein [Methylophaga sp.]|nr:DUF4197 domain-containing protein [Methylophaga sp.]
MPILKNTPVILLSVCLTFFSATSVAGGWGGLLDNLNQSTRILLGQESAGSTDTATLISGLKQALEIGTERAVAEVSQPGGYLNNANIRIPLPTQVQQAGRLMRQLGLGQLADNFENSMNRAAEQAAPQATAIMMDAIRNMTIEDARGILEGGDNAATEFFQRKTRDQLTDMFRPTISNSLDSVGSTRYYNDLNRQVSAVPVVGQNLNVDLPDYVTGKALDGLFLMIAAEEKKIRDNPAARTTELLQQVFGNR